MKIGILTFHCAANYGAVLQTYALQEFLRSEGHDVRVIDYRPNYLIEPYKAFKYRWKEQNGSFFSKVKGVVRACLVVPIRRRRNRMFSDFVRKRLSLDALNLEDVSNTFDAFIFGSDQIWNPRITRGIDPVFVGNFPAACGKRLIAYAASVGDNANLDKDAIRALQQVVSRFDVIGCRESSLQSFFRQHFHREIVPVLDPVLLAGRSLFDSIVVSPRETKPYLLLFQLGRDDEVYQYAVSLADRLNLKLIEIVSSGDSLKNLRMRQSLSIGSFLGYIRNASFVIPFSFHGVAFSLLFERQFVVPCLTNTRDNRIQSLLKCVDLEDRMMSLGIMNIPSSINYPEVKNKFQLYRNSSTAFLRSALAE